MQAQEKMLFILQDKATSSCYGYISRNAGKLDEKGNATTDFRQAYHMNFVLSPNLDNLKNRGPYDHIFSNFAGLNCTDELNKVLDSFNCLLKPGGFVTLVILPKFCLWEFLLLFKGKFKLLSRFAGRKEQGSYRRRIFPLLVL